MTPEERKELALDLHALRSEAEWQWHKVVEGEPFDLVALQVAWDRIVSLLMQMDNSR